MKQICLRRVLGTKCNWSKKHVWTSMALKINPYKKLMARKQGWDFFHIFAQYNPNCFLFPHFHCFLYLLFGPKIPNIVHSKFAFIFLFLLFSLGSCLLFIFLYFMSMLFLIFSSFLYIIIFISYFPSFILGIHYFHY